MAENALQAVVDDIEAQAEASFAVEREAEVGDRGRAEYGQVALAERLMASRGADVRLDVWGVGPLRGTVAEVAHDWVSLQGPRDWVVRLTAVDAASGISAKAVPDVVWPSTTRLRLASVLRGLAAERELCAFHLLDGRRYDGTPLRVGADFVEVATMNAGCLVAFPALAALSMVARR